ncbi:MAG: hypothetical protein EDM05_025345 [Leptolyngbya sp. IPPAS B-1204]|nr:hypothetical protein [Elainella sp. C42_A2020_010]
MLLQRFANTGPVTDFNVDWLAKLYRLAVVNPAVETTSTNRIYTDKTHLTYTSDSTER